MLATALLAAILPATARAEVTESSASGFTVSGSVEAAASAEEAWTAFVSPARYWNGEHSWSGDAANLSMDQSGCFCERIPGHDGLPDGSVEHMRVVYAMPYSELRLRGSLGPLQSEALVGLFTVTFVEAGGRTMIGWDYVVGGHARFPLEQVAPAVDMVIAEQMGRLADVLGR